LPTTGAVVIAGDHPLSRSRLAEEARLRLGLTVVIAAPDLDDSAAETLILSGRADAVAR
jgi:anthraniloyl-CoA monooxygenase